MARPPKRCQPPRRPFTTNRWSARITCTLDSWSYLAGQPDRALQAFTAARQLQLNFKQTWDGALKNPELAAYRKVGDDRAFVDRVMK